MQYKTWVMQWITQSAEDKDSGLDFPGKSGKNDCVENQSIL